MVATLPIYELVSNNQKKYGLNNRKSINTNDFIYSKFNGNKFEKQNAQNVVLTPALAYEQEKFQGSNQRIFNHDFNRVKQDIKASRYKYEKDKSLYVQKQLFSSLDIENILEIIDSSNDQRKNQSIYNRVSYT